MPENEEVLVSPVGQLKSNSFRVAWHCNFLRALTAQRRHITPYVFTVLGTYYLIPGAYLPKVVDT